MLNAAYSAFTALLSGAVLPLFLASERGRSRLAERFGCWNLICGEPLAWFHGASVGEVNGLLPLIGEYRKRNPSEKILLTATSSTALERLPDAVTHARLLPFDSNFWIRKALRQISITKFIVSETELWPGLISQLHRKGVPCYLVNGKLSDFTWPRYRRLRFIFGPVLRKFSKIMVTGAKAANRFQELGVAKEKIFVTGNSKYDQPPAITDGAQADRLRRELFLSDGAVVVLGSIRPSEERYWFPPIKEALESGAALNVVVAPRHKEKFEYFADELKRSGIPFKRWSEMGGSAASERVVLLDTMGVLSGIYAIADLAFIGATLVDLGGHNPLEAAQYKVGVCMGPYATNIKDVFDELLSKDALYLVKSRDDVAALIHKLLKERASLKVKGSRAFEVWQANFGATERILEKLDL
ncbi:MAG: hypothetical protein J5J00_13435 [Deltaproteobacteria bacterium]|nr:hypothetical protein [Deltaproteobacteria bacterium]